MTQSISKALVVDDSRLARIALSKLLQKRNVEVDVVGTGAEALDYLRSGQPDIVFMDYMMPDMDGFETTRRIRELSSEDPGLPVVMYTSQDSDEDRQKAKELGIAGFLSKPSGEQKLDDVLESLRPILAARPPVVDRITPEVVTKAGSSGKPADAPVASVNGTEPALAAEAPLIPWDEISTLAREVAQAQLSDTAVRAARDELDTLRREIDNVTTAARKAAEGAAQEAAEAIADRTARLIAEGVAEETAQRVAAELGPQTSKRIMEDLRGQVASQVEQTLDADNVRELLAATVLESGLPQLRDAVVQQAAPELRRQLADEVLAKAQQKAKEVAQTHAAEAAREAVAAELATSRADAEQRMRAIAAEAVAGVRRGLWLGAGAAVALAGAGVVLGLVLGGI